MSINHLSLVNQKLAYAEATVRLLKASSIESQAPRKLDQQALVDAALFHMIMALHFYLRELAEHHHVKNISVINSAQDLVTALQQIDRVSSEASELLSLVEAGDAWLGRLVHCFGKLSKSPAKPKEKKAFGHENFIELTEVDEQIPFQPTPELLTLWLDSFRKLIIRHRETSAEY